MPIAPDCITVRLPVSFFKVKDNYCITKEHAKNSIFNLRAAQECLNRYKEYADQINDWRDKNVRQDD